MTILVDFNPVAMGAIYAQMEHVSENGEIQKDIVRHMIFDSMRFIIRSHSKKYGAPIICYDTNTNWRKEEFKLYKANRKKSRDAQEDFDWDEFFSVLNSVKEDIQNHLPYLSIEQDRAEADCIIATLARYISETEPFNPVLIYSTDGDFKQLHGISGVEQWTPMFDRYVTCEDPHVELMTKIVKGDAKDGVPNIKSDDDTIITDGKRQKPISKKFLQPLIEAKSDSEIEELLDEEEFRKFKRNRKLIDLSQVPMEIQKEIIDKYKQNQIQGTMAGLMDYFSQNDMNQLFGKLEEFKCLKTTN